MKHAYNDGKPHAPQPLSILTVGDGDFSCSLALKRAYPHLISSLTATTLLSSKEKLIETYPQASISVLQELQNEDVNIMYNVDATMLHSDSRFAPYSFDLISFHHPHLGYIATSTSGDGSQETVHAKNALLIREYLRSAMLLRKPTGYLHVCVACGSFEKWKIMETIKDLNLEFACRSPFLASKPMLQHFSSGSPKIEDQKNKSNLKCSTDVEDNDSTMERRLKECLRTKKRKGHWLGKYGYRHQPTYPHDTIFQTNKSNSIHIFLGESKRGKVKERTKF